MTQQHPITPPWELVQQWVDTYFGGRISQSNFHVDLATQAAQWGADQELEACCEWLGQKVLLQHQSDVVPALRAARRPKPPSWKEQALETLKYPKDFWSEAEVDTIRRALEQLPD
jgi:hypothetical protein